MTLILAGPELAFQRNTCIDLSPEDVDGFSQGGSFKTTKVQLERVTWSRHASKHTLSPNMPEHAQKQ